MAAVRRQRHVPHALPSVYDANRALDTDGDGLICVRGGAGEVAASTATACFGEKAFTLRLSAEGRGTTREPGSWEGSGIAPREGPASLRDGFCAP